MKNHIDKEGSCWLCQRYRKLTEEHIPPHAAYNDRPIFLQEVSKRTQETGVLTWQRGPLHHGGLSVKSLCGECNEKAGRKFAPSYIDLGIRVAERIGTIRARHHFQIQRVKKPRLVLKQVIQQFITANGPNFVTSNPWVRPFLISQGDESLPPDVFVYLFATNMASVRTTGISGHIQVGQSQIRIVSEFTFWPVGTVLSYGELPGDDIAPIHHWSRISCRSNQTADITLCANPTASALPLDFRTRDEMEVAQIPATTTPDPSLLDELREQVLKKGGKGNSPDDFFYSAHPSQVDLMRKRKG